MYRERERERERGKTSALNKHICMDVGEDAHAEIDTAVNLHCGNGISRGLDATLDDVELGDTQGKALTLKVNEDIL